MSELVPCSGCRRHFRATDSACPFCSMERLHAPTTAPTRSVMKLTRAALFAGAAFLLPACGGSPKKADNTDTTDTTDSTDGKGGAIKEKTGDGDDETKAEDEREDAEDLEERELEDMHRRRGGDCTPDGVCPPYGAPPSVDDRIV